MLCFTLLCTSQEYYDDKYGKYDDKHGKYDDKYGKKDEVSNTFCLERLCMIRGQDSRHEVLLTGALLVPLWVCG